MQPPAFRRFSRQPQAIRAGFQGNRKPSARKSAGFQGTPEPYIVQSFKAPASRPGFQGTPEPSIVQRFNAARRSRTVAAPAAPWKLWAPIAPGDTSVCSTGLSHENRPPAHPPRAAKNGFLKKDCILCNTQWNYNHRETRETKIRPIEIPSGIPIRMLRR